MGANMGGAGASKVAEPSGDFAMQPAEKLALTDECHHYEGKHEVPWDIQK